MFIYATKFELYMNQRWKIAITGILQNKRSLTVELQPGQFLHLFLLNIAALPIDSSKN